MTARDSDSMLTAHASDSMFYPLTLCALQIVFMITIMTLQSTTIKIDPNSVVLLHSVLTVWYCQYYIFAPERTRSATANRSCVSIHGQPCKNFPNIFAKFHTTYM